MEHSNGLQSAENDVDSKPVAPRASFAMRPTQPTALVNGAEAAESNVGKAEAKGGEVEKAETKARPAFSMSLTASEVKAVTVKEEELDVVADVPNQLVQPTPVTLEVDGGVVAAKDSADVDDSQEQATEADEEVGDLAVVATDEIEYGPENRPVVHYPTPPEGCPASFEPAMPFLDQKGDVVITSASEEVALMLGMRPPHIGSAQRCALQRAVNYSLELGLRLIRMKVAMAKQQQRMITMQEQTQKQQGIQALCTVYIGSISYEVREEHLKNLFEPFGPLKQINMSWDSALNKHMGYAFAEFEVPEAAELAIAHSNNHYLGSRNLRVGRPSNVDQAAVAIKSIMRDAQKYNRVFVASVQEDVTEDDLKEVFGVFGEVRCVQLAMNQNSLHNQAKHLGYGFVDFASPQGCVDSLTALNGIDLAGKQLRVGRCITPVDIQLNRIPLSNKYICERLYNITTDPITGSLVVAQGVAVNSPQMSSRSSPQPSSARARSSRFGPCALATTATVPPPAVVRPTVVSVPVATGSGGATPSTSSGRFDRPAPGGSSPAAIAVDILPANVAVQMEDVGPEEGIVEVTSGSDVIKNGSGTEEAMDTTQPGESGETPPVPTTTQLEEAVDPESLKQALVPVADAQKPSTSNAVAIYGKRKRKGGKKKKKGEKLIHLETDSLAVKDLVKSQEAVADKLLQNLQLTERQRNLIEFESAQSLSAQEDMKIKGNEARNMLMHKLMRRMESPVLVLRNMVGVEDVDEFLEEEIEEECSKHGVVEKVIIYQETQGQTEDASVIVKIFVKFTLPSEAEAAKKVLDGRFFGGRTVKAEIYDSFQFNIQDYSS